MPGLWPEKIGLPRKCDFSRLTITESIAWCNPFGRYIIFRFMRIQKCDKKYIFLFQFVLQTCSLLLHKYFDVTALSDLTNRVGEMLGMLCIYLPNCWSANSIHHAMGHLPAHILVHGGIMLVGMQAFESFGGRIKRCFSNCTKDFIASIMKRFHKKFALEYREEAEAEKAAEHARLAAAAPAQPKNPPPEYKARYTAADETPRVDFQGRGKPIDLSQITNASHGLKPTDNTVWRQVQDFVLKVQCEAFRVDGDQKRNGGKSKENLYQRFLDDQGETSKPQDFINWTPTTGLGLTGAEKEVIKKMQPLIKMRENAEAFKAVEVNGRRFVSQDHDTRIHVNRFAIVNTEPDFVSRNEEKKLTKAQRQQQLDSGMYVCSVRLIIQYRPWGDHRVYDIFMGEYYHREPARNKV